MLVKENLFLNGNKLTYPQIGVDSTIVKLKDNNIYFDKLNNYISRLTIDGYEEKLAKPIDPESSYYIGFYGNYFGTISLYKGKGYIRPKTLNEFNYIEMKGADIKGPLHIRGSKDEKGVIFALAMYKDSPSQVYLPSAKSLPQSQQPLYPPEGDYTEISPI